MRTFFAIDQQSSLRLSTLRGLLALNLSCRQFEILPLEKDRFTCTRTNLNGLLTQARYEAKKIYSHYADTRLCVVVFGFQTKIIDQPDAVGFFDYAIPVQKDGKYEWRLLNPPVSPGKKDCFWASSPALQPLLVETLLEVADIPTRPC